MKPNGLKCVHCGKPLTGYQRKFCGRDCNWRTHQPSHRRGATIPVVNKKPARAGLVEKCTCAAPVDYMTVALDEPCQQRERDGR